MNQDFRWGGINGRYLFNFLMKNIWMGFAVGLIFYMIGSILSARSVWSYYSTNGIIAVSRTHMSVLPENLEYRMQYASSACTVLNSDAFISEAKQNCNIKNASVYAEVLPDTNLLSITCQSEDPRAAYMFLSYLIDNFSTITQYVSGDLTFSVIVEPTIPRNKIVQTGSAPSPYVLFAAGIGLVLFALVCLYAFPITYKGTGEIFKQYGNDILQILPYKRDPNSRRFPFFKGKSGNKTDIADRELKKLAFLLNQRITENDTKVLLFTSAADSEGKHTICSNVISELTKANLSVLYIDGKLMSVMSQNSIMKDMVVYDETLGCDIIKAESDQLTYSCESVSSLIKDLRETTDVIIICGVSGVESTTLSIWADIADEVYLIIRENTADIRVIDSLYAEFKNTSRNFGGCILNAFY